MNWETCSHKDECMNGCRYGKGCYEDDLNNAMGGKPWGECMCGIDENGNVPNSKIKDLIKECTTIEREFYDNGLGRGYYEDEVFDKEKYAKLIIKECINLCQENGEDVDNGNCFVRDAKRLDLYNNYFGTGSYECAELIKQHFGIE